jgi:diguanylate cyclase (GGDEF)-like protein
LHFELNGQKEKEDAEHSDKEYMKKFGVAVDRVMHLAEETKKVSRNSFGFEGIGSELFEQSEKEIKDKNIENQNIVLEQALERLMDDRRKRCQEYGEFLADDKMAQSLSGVVFEEKAKGTQEAKAVYETFLQLQEERYFDHLTRAKNYDYLTQVCDLELQKARQAGHDYSVVSFDLDNLKAFNDTWGHSMGDFCLRAVSLSLQRGLQDLKSVFPELADKIVKTSIEPSVIRATGGEEFILTLPGISSADAKIVMAHLSALTKKEIQQFVNSEVPENSRNDEEFGKSYRTYAEKIKEFIASTKVKGKNEKEYSRAESEIEKIGTLTCGVVGIKELPIDLNAGQLRALADKIGEDKKNELRFDNGLAISGRGGIFGLEAIAQKELRTILVQVNPSAMAKLEGEEERGVLAKIRNFIAGS